MKIVTLLNAKPAPHEQNELMQVLPANVTTQISTEIKRLPVLI